MFIIFPTSNWNFMKENTPIIVSPKQIFISQAFESFCFNVFNCWKDDAVQKICGDFPGGPVVKNLPSNAGDAGSIPCRGTKIPHAVGQLSPCATTTEPVCSGAHAPQLESLCAVTTEPACSGAHASKLEKPACHNEEPTCRNERSPMLHRRSHVLQLRPNAAK